jgi:hypothetical protein
VFFCWGIWERGPGAVGINATVFALGVFVAFQVYAVGKYKLPIHHVHWVVPLFLMFLSFSIYENPYITVINLFIIPIIFACYQVYASTPHSQKVFWNYAWMQKLTSRIVEVPASVQNALASIAEAVTKAGHRTHITFLKVLIGLLVFAVLAITIFIPLLSSAEPLFAEHMKDIVEFISKIITPTIFSKILVFIVMSLALVSGMLCWTKQTKFTEKKGKPLDDIISGIVLGGIFLLYLLFLWTQIGTIWVSELPVAFEETEYLVKRGFWQLFILSVINVFLFLFTYRRTAKIVQFILTAFTFASLALLLSGAQRMAMYVYYYGFSYEKFFASYTVLFAIILFAKLIYCLFQRKKHDIVRFTVFSFLWMYSVATVLPTEQFIFRANAYLAAKPESRISMYELQMLSADVYGSISKLEDKEGVWFEWKKNVRDRSKQKKIYEMNAQDIILRSLYDL